MEKSKKIVLQTKEVTKEYKMGGVVVKALQGVSLSIHDGEFVAIMCIRVDFPDPEGQP